jgi:cytochrome c-type biogenesis protein CcmH/NrfG
MATVDEARAALLDALKPSATDAVGYASMGRVLVTQGDFAAAAFAFSAALEHTKSADLWAALGYCEQKLNRLQNAADAYEKAIHAGLDDVQVWANLGEARLDLLQYGHAAEALGKAIEKDPKGDHPASVRARALVLKAVRDINALKSQKEAKQHG